MNGMTNTNPAEYWSHLPTMFPWRYKVRKALAGGAVLQVSGPLAGTRHTAILLRLQPSGWFQPVWKKKLRVTGDTDPRAAALDALVLDFEARAGNGPWHGGMLDAARAARSALGPAA